MHLYAGIVLVLAGLIAMGDTIYYSVQMLTFSQYQNITALPPAAFAVSQICGLIAIWSEALAILGGILAIQRLNWRLAAACAMFALVSIGGLGALIPEYGLIAAGVAAGIALVFAVRGREEFLS